jgi:hypothetical protein
MFHLNVFIKVSLHVTRVAVAICQHKFDTCSCRGSDSVTSDC